jgi:hypothetical protein
LRPSSPDTTVGQVDVWADPATALPLRVELSAHTGPPLLTSEFDDVDDRPPDPAVLTPTVPPGAGALTAAADDVATALRVLDAPPAPDRLAGRDRTPGFATGLPGVGLYGTDLAAFALVPTSRDVAEQAIAAAAATGGAAVEVPRGRAVLVATPLVTVGIRSRGRGGSLVIGTVTPDLLRRALQELPGRRPA